MLRRIQKHLTVVRFHSKKTSFSDFDSLTQQLASPPQPQSAVRVTEKDLDWSNLQESESEPKADSAEPSDQKEEMIFKEVLSQVLSNNTHSPNSSTTVPLQKPVRNSPLTESILALFDKPEKHEGDYSSVSLIDGLLESAKPQLKAKELAKRKKLDHNLRYVLGHISKMQTNHEVLDYYESVIIPRFDPQADPLLSPCSATEPVVSGETVALILDRSLYYLINDFKDILGAFHIFELSKRHSIDLFTTACSAEVYNHIIRIRWDYYRDLYAVVNLAAEIAINAIQPTLETTELLGRIYREAIDSSRGVESKIGMPLWSGQDLRRLEELSRYRVRFQSMWASKPTLRF